MYCGNWKLQIFFSGAMGQLRKMFHKKEENNNNEGSEADRGGDGIENQVYHAF